LCDLSVQCSRGAFKSFARSIEVCRFLKHSFKYYRRSVLHEMSLEGKLTEISRALAGNAPMAMQGIGLFLPIVAAYDKRKDDPVIQKLVRQQKAARVDKYQLKPRINRRDPLIDPRRPGGADAAAGDPADVQKQRDLVDQLKFEMEVLKEDVRQEQAFVQEHKYVALASIKPMIDEKCAKLDTEITQAEGVVTVPELREALHDDVIVAFEQIKGQRKFNSSLPVVVSRKQTLEFLEGMKASMETHEYEKVTKALAEFEKLMKGQVIAEDAGEVVDEMHALAKEAQVMTEFLGLHLAVTGLINKRDGSIVLINNKARKVGDFVDQAGSKHFVVATIDLFIQRCSPRIQNKIMCATCKFRWLWHSLLLDRYRFACLKDNFQRACCTRPIV